MICQRCHQHFKEEENKDTSCQFHPLAFVCRPHPPDHYVYEIKDTLMEELKKWSAEFWDCCGNEDRNHKGCMFEKHISY